MKQEILMTTYRYWQVIPTLLFMKSSRQMFNEYLKQPRMNQPRIKQL